MALEGPFFKPMATQILAWEMIPTFIFMTKSVSNYIENIGIQQNKGEV